MQPAINRAIAIYREQLADDVDVRFTIEWDNLGADTIKGFATVQYLRVAYGQFRAALVADQTSVDDASAVDALPRGNVFPLVLNYGLENPSGPGSSVPYFDNDGSVNNQFIRVPQPVARAIGIYDARDPSTDGAIRFNRNATWDYDSSDGVDSGVRDFEATLLHELGHILGFTSRLDTRLAPIDRRSLPEDDYDFVTPWDLFVFSDVSVDQFGVGVCDWSADNRPKYFSFDGGVTIFQPVARGLELGDGYTRGHWENRVGLEEAIGIMDPATVPRQTVLETDVRALDVIGWDLASAVPVELTLEGVEFTNDEVTIEWSPPQEVGQVEIWSAPSAVGTYRPETGGEYTTSRWVQDLGAEGVRLYRIGQPPARRRGAGGALREGLATAKPWIRDQDSCLCGRH